MRVLDCQGFGLHPQFHEAVARISRRLMLRAGLLLLAARLLSSRGDRLQRLERIISNRGAGSRNEVSRLIAQGRVKDAQGRVIRSGAKKFPVDGSFEMNISRLRCDRRTASVFIDDVELPDVPLLALYHKARGAAHFNQA